MKDVTKIDIMGIYIYAYDELINTKEIYPLTKEYDFFIDEFSDTQELLTVNISDPIARVVKFYNIENSIPKSFTELDYSDMDQEQQRIFDTFVDMIKSSTLS